MVWINRWAGRMEIRHNRGFRANGTLAFHRWWHHLNTVFTINTQRSLWTKGNDNPFGLAAINDFLRGFADIVRLGEFAIHQRTG